jgi:hypothetical protein
MQVSMFFYSLKLMSFLFFLYYYIYDSAMNSDFFYLNLVRGFVCWWLQDWFLRPPRLYATMKAAVVIS